MVIDKGPRSGQWEIYSDDELQAYVKLLNTLYYPSDEWRLVRARKDHDDLFGDQISEGEFYYKREYGAAWDDVIKVSRRSMDALMYCLFCGNLELERLTKDLERQRQEEIHKRFMAARPLQHLKKMGNYQ